MSRSTSMRRWMPACCTFTTASVAPALVPLARRARCTWPIEAEASGVVSKSTKSVSSGASSSVSMVVADGVRVVGRHVGLQLLEFVGERHADLVGPRAEDLAELDERRAELFDRQPDASLAAEVSERFAVAVAEDALHHRQIEAADPAGEAILAENREDLAPAIGIAIDLRDGGDFHPAVFIR